MKDLIDMLRGAGTNVALCDRAADELEGLYKKWRDCENENKALAEANAAMLTKLSVEPVCRYKGDGWVQRLKHMLPNDSLYSAGDVIRLQQNADMMRDNFDSANRRIKELQQENNTILEELGRVIINLPPGEGKRTATPGKDVLVLRKERDEARADVKILRDALMYYATGKWDVKSFTYFDMTPYDRSTFKYEQPDRELAFDALTATAPRHDLYKTGDVGCPEQILDRNGEVVLGLCKKCGMGEVDLGEWCRYCESVSDGE